MSSIFQSIEVVEEVNDGNFFLRKISPYDNSFLYESLKDEKMTELLSLGPLKSFKHSKKLVKNYLQYWDKYLQFNYIIELRAIKSVERVGSISLWDLSWLHKRAKIGIWLIPSQWNKGIGKSALSLIKIIAFNHLKLNRLEAYVAVSNDRSINLFKNSGFSEEGILKEYLYLKGKYYDTIVLAYLKSLSLNKYR